MLILSQNLLDNQAAGPKLVGDNLKKVRELFIL